MPSCVGLRAIRPAFSNSLSFLEALCCEMPKEEAIAEVESLAFDDADFSAIENEANAGGKTSTVSALAAVKKIYLEIKDSENKKDAATAVGVPLRQDNPYVNISDLSVIQSKIKDSEAKIQTVVIDQRNQETASNFADALKSNKTNIGILQFGAGHEDGLVKELNKKGLSVIVVVPTQVQNSPSQ